MARVHMPFVVLADGPGLVFVVFESAALSAADLPCGRVRGLPVGGDADMPPARMRVGPDGGFRPDAFDRADGASFLGACVQSPLTAFREEPAGVPFVLEKIRITLFVDGGLSHGVPPACAGGVDHASRVRLTSSRLYSRRPLTVGSSSLPSSMNPLPGAQRSRKFNGTPIGPS